MADKYLVSNAPFLRSADFGKNTKSIMRDLMISLLPVIIFAICKNVIDVLINRSNTGATLWMSLYPLFTLIISPIISLVAEAICLAIMKKDEIKSFKDLIVEVKNGFGMFPGLFIVLISPIYIKFWQLLVSILVGEIIGKMVFGGFGQNIFNPALVGRAFMAFAFSNDLGTSCFAGEIAGYAANANSYLNINEYVAQGYNIAGSTVLGHLSSVSLVDSSAEALLTIGNKTYSYLDMFIGTIPGTLGETSALACIIGCIYLVIRKVIDWRIPVVYVGTVALNVLVIGFFTKDYAFGYTLFQLLSGGLLFGAVYMATEPVTSPKTHFGRIMYAMMLGVLTVLFRLVGNNPEGVATAIVTMNVFGLCINKYCCYVKVDGKIDKKEAMGIVVFSLIFILFFAYNVYSVVSM